MATTTKFLNKLQDKRVLIIGGSSGIGYGVAEGCLEFGAEVVIASRSRSKVESAVSSLRATYPQHAAKVRGHAITLDASPGVDVERDLVALFEFATEGGTHPLDHVVETAGDLSLMGKVTLATATPETLAKLASVRQFGVGMLAKVAARYVAKSAHSSFTMTSGVLIQRPRRGMAFTAAVGAAKEGLTRGLAVDMAPVRVNTVSPGAVETDLLFAQVAPDAGEEAKDQVRKTYAAMTLVGRTALPGDLAETYLALMRSGFQTGTLVQVEGGYLLM
ncbi:hypothetical protein PV08_06213 [Exophiala spinifera]|uniref:Short chain dehydrogenase n=1 Tax=Exophiala spinifera TaxID=91928 RepID=A0A0D1ZTR1_9EURO|nr:uncharacterized protein PV08_06213 [Exophiala spinifera]KIW16162.1 hypothetical protein PV08_06213 [Exophiala spinifera]